MSTLFPQKLLVVDPGMAQIFGHHYAYNTALRAWLATQGNPGRFLFSKLLPEEMQKEFPESRAVFSWSLYARPQEPGYDPMAFAQYSARAFANDLHTWADGEADAETLVFSHTLDPTALYGLALWHGSLPESRRPCLALNLMLDVSDGDFCRALLGLSLPLLRQSKRVRLFGGAKASALLLSELSGEPCDMLPSPLPDGLENYLISACPDRPVFGITGDARQGKNLQSLPPAILRYLASGGKGLFHIQLTASDEALTPVLIALHELTRDYPQQVHLGYRHLEEAEYYAHMGRLSALILPYSPDAYHRYRPSGPVIESALLGVPAIVCAGGFAEEELAPLDNGSLFMENADPASLAKALLRFEREKDERKARAMAARPGYAVKHGTGAIMRMISGR